MHWLSSLAISAACIPVLAWAAEWEFTAPDPSEKINLSQPITFEWTMPENDGAEWTELGISIYVHTVGPDHDVTYHEGVAGNITPSMLKYTWDPKPLIDRLDEDQRVVSTDDENYIVAEARAPKQKAVADFKLEDLAVEGYERMDSLALSTYGSPGLAFGAGAFIVAAAANAWLL